jgi:hypothetical protein
MLKDAWQRHIAFTTSHYYPGCDLIVPVRLSPFDQEEYTGLFIEVKHRTGYISDAQNRAIVSKLLIAARGIVSYGPVVLIVMHLGPLYIGKRSFQLAEECKLEESEMKGQMRKKQDVSEYSFGRVWVNHPEDLRPPTSSSKGQSEEENEQVRVIAVDVGTKRKRTKRSNKVSVVEETAVASSDELSQLAVDSTVITSIGCSAITFGNGLSEEDYRLLRSVIGVNVVHATLLSNGPDWFGCEAVGMKRLLSGCAPATHLFEQELRGIALEQK